MVFNNFPKFPVNLDQNVRKVDFSGQYGIFRKETQKCEHLPFSIKPFQCCPGALHSDSMASKRDSTASKRDSIRQFLKRDSTTVSSVPSDFTLTSLREALDTPPPLRTDFHLKVLRAYTGHLAIFAELTETIHSACCRAMKYEYCGKGTVGAR